MSGHSHWAGIKHKKAAVDAKRGRLWSKLARGIIVAAKRVRTDPQDFRLDRGLEIRTIRPPFGGQGCPPYEANLIFAG